MTAMTPARAARDRRPKLRVVSPDTKRKHVAVFGGTPVNTVVEIFTHEE